ncbi:hypothetical protein GGI12_000549 [Dipsacomyces acuminosporus]|nr:hypothetical protein GGI12_000549 [Dipsacomyces acuminosporus]
MDIPTVFPLTPLEAVRDNLRVLQVSLLFKDPPTASEPASIERLKSSFDMLVEFYPILRGHAEESEGEITVQLNANDVKKELFTSHIESGMAVGEFESIKYRREQWPAAINKLATKATVPNMDKLASAIVARLTDGYVVTLSVSHLLVDVAGISILFEQWASLTKDGRLSRRVDFDHERFWNKFINPLKPDIHTVYKLTQGVDLTQIRIPEGMGAKQFNTESVLEGREPAACVLHIPKAKLDEVATEFNKGNDGKPVHGVQLFYALLWQRYVMAARNSHQTPPPGDNEKTYMCILINARHLLEDCSDYIGIAVSSTMAGVDSKDILAQPVRELAMLCKTYIHDVTHGAVAQLAMEIARADGDLFKINMFMKSKPESRLTISNVSRLPFLDTDFGNGTPEASLWGTLRMGDSSIWMPLKDGGVDVYLGLDTGMLEELAKDEVLAQYCELIVI